MFVEFRRPGGKLCSVAIDKVIGFFEPDGEATGCSVLMNATTGNGGTNEVGTTAVQLGVFTVACAEPYEDLKRTIQQHVIATLRQAMVAQTANAAPQILRPRG